MKEFVLALVFDQSHNHLLLMERKKDPYTGLLNGIGGKVDPGETPLQAMKREFIEETGYTMNPDIHELVTLTFPNEHLHVYYVSIEKQPIIVKENHEGIYDWYEVKEEFFDTLNPNLAGGGNLSYFIKYALDTYKKDI